MVSVALRPVSNYIMSPEELGFDLINMEILMRKLVLSTDFEAAHLLALQRYDWVVAGYPFTHYCNPDG